MESFVLLYLPFHSRIQHHLAQRALKLKAKTRKNKTVLLRDCKRRISRSVASLAFLSVEDTPCAFCGEGVPLSFLGECTPCPVQGWWAVSRSCWRGTPSPRLGGVPPRPLPWTGPGTGLWTRPVHDRTGAPPPPTTRAVKTNLLGSSDAPDTKNVIKRNEQAVNLTMLLMQTDLRGCRQTKHTPVQVQLHFFTPINPQKILLASFISLFTGNY